MSIEVHTDTNNSVVINVDTNPSNADIHIEPTRNAGSPIGTEALYGPRGPKGDKGDKGDSGEVYNIIGGNGINVEIDGDNVTISKQSYTHYQNTSSDVWNINHDLNKSILHVTLIDSAGNVFYPPVRIIDNNNCQINLIAEMSGRAYIS